MTLRELFVDSLPRPAIRVFAKPYIAGDSMDAAVEKAAALADSGVASTIDILGEDAGSDQDIDHYVELYCRLITTITSEPRFCALPDNTRPSVSLKPSSFVVAPKDADGIVLEPESIDMDRCTDSISFVMDCALTHRVRATIDMENHQWTSLTLRIYKRLFAQYEPVIGTVLQSRLYRTEDDINDLPNGGRIRLCIGIYDEPADIAMQNPAEMKARMIPLARQLFDKGIFVEFATHDLPLIARFVHELILPGGIGADQFETQTLMGVPRQAMIDQLTSGRYFDSANGSQGASRSLRGGIVHRLYVPFAEDWDRAIAYARRRLRHSPNIFWTGLINAPRVLYSALRGR